MINKNTAEESKIFWSGCNYWANTGANEFEPVGTATSMHDCIGCDKLETCNLKKATEVWDLNL